MRPPVVDNFNPSPVDPDDELMTQSLWHILASITSYEHLYCLDITLVLNFFSQDFKWLLNDTDMTRDGLRLLDTFFGKQMQDILDRLHGLRKLCWTLKEFSVDYGIAWWKEKITRRVSGHLHPAAILDVEIVLPRMYFGFGLF